MKNARVKWVRTKPMRTGARIIGDSPAPDPFVKIASLFVRATIAYSGKGTDAIYADLSQPIEGVSSSDQERVVADSDEDEQQLFSNPIYIKNMGFIADALAGAMQGKELTSLQRSVVAKQKWLKLPSNLAEYAADHMQLAQFYDNPTAALEQFTDMFHRTVVPVRKEALLRKGITAEIIHETLKNNPYLDPVYALWHFSDVMPTILERNHVHMINSGIVALSQALFDTSGSETAVYSLRQLLGLDESPLFEKTLLNAAKADSLEDLPIMPLEFVANLSSLPLDINLDLDQKRREALSVEMGDLRDSPLSSHEKQAMQAFSMVKPALKAMMRMAFPAAPTAFLHAQAKIREQRKSLKWTDVPEALRNKFEQAGFGDASQIALAVNGMPGQQNLTSRFGFILRHSQGKKGYIVTEQDVMGALTHPQNAAYANGGARDMLYDTLYALTKPDIDFETFYGLKTSEPQTLQQTVVAAFHKEVRDALRAFPKFQDAVTDEQMAVLLQIGLSDFKRLFENPRINYSSRRNGDLLPNATMQIIEDKLCISFAEGWRQLDEEQRRVAEDLKRAKADVGARVAQTPASPAAPVEIDPWQDVPPHVMNVVRSKFETPLALVEAIVEGIRKTAAPADANGKLHHSVAFEVKRALRDPSRGFADDGRPIDIIYAHIMRVLQLGPREAMKVFAVANGDSKVFQEAKQNIQANLVALFMANPKLSHIVSWNQLRNFNSKADVSALTGNERDFSAAYRLRSTKDPVPVLLPSQLLLDIAAVANTGQPEAQRYQPDQIVDIARWRAVYKDVMRKDPFPAAATAASGYRLQIG